MPLNGTLKFDTVNALSICSTADIIDMHASSWYINAFFYWFSTTTKRICLSFYGRGCASIYMHDLCQIATHKVSQFAGSQSSHTTKSLCGCGAKSKFDLNCGLWRIG